jgi:hypothetical protein
MELKLNRIIVKDHLSLTSDLLLQKIELEAIDHVC